MTDDQASGGADLIEDDEITLRMETILAGFRGEQERREHKKHRRNLAIALLVILYAVIIGWLAWDNNRDNAQASHLRTVDLQRSAQIDWDSQAEAHRACERQADGRARSRLVLEQIVDLLGTPTPDTPPERVEEIEAQVAIIRGLIADGLPPLDCDELAPMPEGSRPKVDA